MKSTPKVTALFSLMLMMLLFFSVANAKIKESEKPADTADYSMIVETVIVTWPEEDNFKLGFNYDDSVRWIRIFYPQGQSSYKWQEMGWVEFLKAESRQVNLPGTARERFLDARKMCPKATWDIIERSGKDADYPYIIFQIKCPEYSVGDPADIQVWKLMAGKTGMFVVEWSYRGEKIPDDRKEEILEILKNSTPVAMPIEETGK